MYFIIYRRSIWNVLKYIRSDPKQRQKIIIIIIIEHCSWACVRVWYVRSPTPQANQLEKWNTETRTTRTMPSQWNEIDSMPALEVKFHLRLWCDAESKRMDESGMCLCVRWMSMLNSPFCWSGTIKCTHSDSEQAYFYASAPLVWYLAHLDGMMRNCRNARIKYIN